MSCGGKIKTSLGSFKDVESIQRKGARNRSAPGRTNKRSRALKAMPFAFPLKIGRDIAVDLIISTVLQRCFYCYRLFTVVS
jgi:hypothetical protein